jgi:hypothetical protein
MQGHEVIVNDDMNPRHIEALLESSQARADPIGQHIISHAGVRDPTREPVSDPFKATLGIADASRQKVAGVAHYSSQRGATAQHGNGPKRPRPDVHHTIQRLSHRRLPLAPLSWAARSF